MAEPTQPVSTAAVAAATTPEQAESAAGLSPEQPHAIHLAWTAGFNASLRRGVAAVVRNGRDYTIYAVGNTLVVTDAATQQQTLLQGHRHAITALALSPCGQFVATADSAVLDAEQAEQAGTRDSAGAADEAETLLVIWDVRQPENAFPVKTFFGPDQGAGLAALAFSHNSKTVFALSHAVPQTLSRYEWTLPATAALGTVAVEGPRQFDLAVDHVGHWLVTIGPASISFWHAGDLIQISATAQIANHRQGANDEASATLRHRERITTAVFLSKSLITGTSDGDALVWSLRAAGPRNPAQIPYVPQKKIRLHEGGVTATIFLLRCFIVSAAQDGHLHIFDEELGLVAWYEHLRHGPIAGVTFLEPETKRGRIIITTVSGKILRVEAGSLYEAQGPQQRRSTGVMVAYRANADRVHAVAMHPHKTELLAGDAAGWVHRWDYSARRWMHAQRIRPTAPTATTAAAPMAAAASATTAVATAAAAAAAKDKQASDSDEPAVGITALVYAPSGELVAVGHTSGHVALAASEVFEGPGDVSTAAAAARSPLPLPSPPPPDGAAPAGDGGGSSRPAVVSLVGSSDPITHLTFSPDGAQLFYADASGLVGLIQWVTGPSGQPAWRLCGRSRLHSQPLVNLWVQETLDAASGAVHVEALSVAQDGHMIAYDLAASGVDRGLVARDDKVVETVSQPRAATAYPNREIQNRLIADALDLKPSATDGVLVATAHGRLQWLTPTGLCRKRLLAPSAASPIEHMIVVRLEAETDDAAERHQHHLLWAAADRTMGMTRFPLDGSPYATTALIAHASPIVALHPTRLPNSCLTLGEDGQINLWQLEPTHLLEQQRGAGPGPQAFFGLFTTEEQRDLEDYFCYVQVRDKKTIPQLEGQIPASDVPDVLQAMGLYLSHADCDQVINEVRYRGMEDTADPQNSEYADLPTVIQLYYNRRGGTAPAGSATARADATALTVDNIVGAVLASQKPAVRAAALDPQSPTPLLATPIETEPLVTLLQTHGETIARDEIVGLMQLPPLPKDAALSTTQSRAAQQQAVQDTLKRALPPVMPLGEVLRLFGLSIAA
ncbi:hypothetical protein CXG81DRAFT_18909 [Caulochytrium protostelioides]|uniref:Cilia- and flagella-associated protein 251 n=1 Tax=Caulochytrium protostelioides TaxID=1555241 RepID=A0A4P9X7T4_9FUNG|nr:hypothetical protein CXG81DRAFT_18909 [Caulochytrium protostelioides]|eukprot:RKP01282.1 hypothetical protein CXG81DRAFT_18909 [Caulochytrium protostelioides]